MTVAYSTLLVDWSYIYDPVNHLRKKMQEKEWFEFVHSNDDLFLSLKRNYSEFAPPNVTFVIEELFDDENQWSKTQYNLDGIYFAMLEKGTGRTLGVAACGRYSLYDVLDPTVGEITYVSKPTRSIHPLSPLRPLIAYQQGGFGLGYFQWDNLMITTGALSPQIVDTIIRTHNLGLPSTEVTGQIDTLHPPGYSTADVTGVTDVPYILSWEKQFDGGYLLKWSNGKQEIVSPTVFDGANKNKTATIADTVTVEPISYVEDGRENKSTINAIPIATEATVSATAKSYAPGHEPWKAFNGNPTDGWLSADGDTSNVWLMYDFGSSGAVLNKWRFQSHPTVPNSSPKRFIIQGSNSLSLSIWDTLCSTFSNTPYRPLGLGEWSDWIPFTNGTSYQYYRFYILESYANG